MKKKQTKLYGRYDYDDGFFCEKADLPALTGLTAKRIRSLREAGEFPEPVAKAQGSLYLWRRDEIEKWAGNMVAPDKRMNMAQLGAELFLHKTTVAARVKEGLLKPDGVDQAGEYYFLREKIAAFLEEKGWSEIAYDFYSGREFARELGVSRFTLYQWKRDGKLPAPTMFFGTCRWPTRVVRDFLIDFSARHPRKKREKLVAPEGFMTAEDLARAISLSASNVYKLVRDGLLSPDRSDAAGICFRRDKIEELFAERGWTEVATDFVRREEFEAILRVKRATMREWIRAGKIPPPIVFFRQLRWPRSVVAKIMENPPTRWGRKPRDAR